MAKKRLIVVHGMGTHTADSVKKEVSEAFKTVFSWYSSIKNDKPEHCTGHFYNNVLVFKFSSS